MLAGYRERSILNFIHAARRGIRGRKLSFRCRRGLVALCTMLLVGCGSVEPASLSGEVQYGGEPIPEGTVTFHPLGATKGDSAGAKIEAGKYLVGSDKGLMPGEYRVSINAWKDTREEIANPEQLEGEPETIPETVQYIPATYNQKSTLEISLKSGSNEQNFSLTEPINIGDQANGEPEDKNDD